MGKAEGLPCSTEVHGLFAASDGALWVNTCASIFRFDGQRFTAVRGFNGLLRGVQVMADATSGGILISTPNGLYETSRVADGSFSLRPIRFRPAFDGRTQRGAAAGSAALVRMRSATLHGRGRAGFGVRT